MPDEVLVYVLGHLGEPPAPIDENVLDRMLSTDRGKEMQAWVPPQPTIGELKQQYGDRTMSDEELLRRYLVPLQDVEATRAAGPASRTYHFDVDGVPESLINDLLAGQRACVRAHRDRDAWRSPSDADVPARRLSTQKGTDIRNHRTHGEGCVTAYEFDTTLDPEYPVLTRGNAGEIMPDIVSPLSATVFFPPLERAWRRSFTETWDVMDWPDCPTTFAPIVGGRFYINISAFRRLADLTPGTSPDDIDRTLFAAGGIRLDPYEAPDEEGYAERGERIAAATASFLEDPPVDRVQREHDAAQARRVEGRAGRASSSNEELLARFESMQPFMETDFVTLFIGSSVSPVALGSLQAGLVEVYGDEGYELGRQAVVGIGGIESADAGKAVASLAGVAGDEFEARVRTGARAVRIPRRERVGDRLTLVGDPPRRPPTSHRRRHGGWGRARPRRRPHGGAREVRAGRRPARSSRSSICGWRAARCGWGFGSGRRRHAS